MKIFIATSYSSKVDYTTGKVSLDYKEWLENIISIVSELGHTSFCALAADNYQINIAKPDEAFSLDIGELKTCDVVLALLDDHVSAGVQTEIGVAIALGKKVILAHNPNEKLGYFNNSIIKAGAASELLIPFSGSSLASLLV